MSVTHPHRHAFVLNRKSVTLQDPFGFASWQACGDFLVLARAVLLAVASWRAKHVAAHAHAHAHAPLRRTRLLPTKPHNTGDSSFIYHFHDHFYLCPSALHTARSPRHVPIALMPAVTGGLAYGSVHSDMRLAAGHPARNCWSAENEGGPGRVVYRTWSCTPTLEVERWSPPLEPGMI